MAKSFEFTPADLLQFRMLGTSSHPAHFWRRSWSSIISADRVVLRLNLDFCVLIYRGNCRRCSVFQLSETWLDLSVRSWVAFRLSKGGRPPTTREGGGSSRGLEPARSIFWAAHQAYISPQHDSRTIFFLKFAGHPANEFCDCHTHFGHQKTRMTVLAFLWGGGRKSSPSLFCHSNYFDCHNKCFAFNFAIFLCCKNFWQFSRYASFFAGELSSPRVRACCFTEQHNPWPVRAGAMQHTRGRGGGGVPGTTSNVGLLTFKPWADD